MNKICIFYAIFSIITSAYAEKVSLYLENDLLAKTDRDYTHGTQLSYSYSYTNDVWLLSGDVYDLEWSLTQLIYTPNPKTVVELQPDERPYAGFLGPSINAKSLVGERLQLVEGLVIGVVGPLSFAEETQTFIHEITGSAKPMGWDNQLENEPILNYSYAANYKLIRNNYFDIISQNEIALGNMFTYGGMGALFRLGYNLNDSFGSDRIEPTVRDPRTLSVVYKPYFYVFACPEGRYVLQNIFLDGNTWKDSYSVEKEPWVGEFSYGIAAGYGNIELSYSYVYRSKEFELQDEHNEFGAVCLTYRY